ncbi:efflux RND transporter periplasmic adaptor subunit [Xanthobacteraceae bacterium Astr-EGSB]|uniref:efflux RND transporter periplasmic adaptor subunit n=1 Tax=Astrobacterium formosum TaxID=3069710 RepID=UPI0027B7B6EA|nr:efflux RND transporter periplasmic adaptor subunit [Xanthobacteraceae bacterium Astr-EGSB]
MSKTPHEGVNPIAADATLDTIDPASPGGPPAAGARISARKRAFALLAAAVALAGGGYYAYDELVLSRHAVTDNAYVGADIAQVTPIVGGPVAEVLVADTQMVKRGDVLVRIDDVDTRLQLQTAEAAYQSALRRVQGYFANDRALAAQIAAREADEARVDAQVQAAQADHEKARIDRDRRNALAANGSVSGDELTAAQTMFRTTSANLAAANAARLQARAAREAAIAARDINAALIAGTTVETNPEVLAARAARDQAQVNLDRMIIRAPVDGVVSRRQVQVGQRVQPGMMLMVVVPLTDVYVDANFKEVQLAKVRPGQSVTLVSDLYGSAAPFKGRVVGFSGGTGAAFAVVPAQNATGNWIKVVQRLSVRIALDAAELAARPLQVGLSMTADVDLSR